MQVKSDQQLISPSKEWDLDYWLKKYKFSQTALNKRILLQLIKDTKDFYNYDLLDDIPIKKLDHFFQIIVKNILLNKLLKILCSYSENRSVPILRYIISNITFYKK